MAIKWKNASTFAYRRCIVSYSDFDGVRIMRMRHEMRGNPVHAWKHDFDTFHPTEKNQKLECSHEAQIPAMVEALRAGKKTLKAS